MRYFLILVFSSQTKGRGRKDTCLKAAQKIFQVLEVIQALWLEHAMLIQQLIHDEVHKGDLHKGRSWHIIPDPQKLSPSRAQPWKWGPTGCVGFSIINSLNFKESIKFRGPQSYPERVSVGAGFSSNQAATHLILLNKGLCKVPVESSV